MNNVGDRPSNLKPCPFCGFTDPHLVEDDAGTWEKVVCPGCDARGPDRMRRYSTGTNSATAGWNTRTPPEARESRFVQHSDPEMGGMCGNCGEHSSLHRENPKGSGLCPEPATPHEPKPSGATGALVGMVAVPDHPQTVLNPNGREGFVIAESRVESGRLLVRGVDTMWFGESALLEIRRSHEPLADPIVPIEIGAGKIRVAICYDIGDPDKVLRELVIYDDGEGFKPVGTDLPEHRGKKVPDVGRVLARLHISNAEGAAVFVRDLQTVVEHARVADGGAALTKGETP